MMERNTAVCCATKSGISRWIAAAVLTACVLTLPAWGQGMTQGVLSPPANVRPPGVKNVGIEQNLNAQIPPDLMFRDETGKAVRLGDYFGKKPVILNLVYYQVPHAVRRSVERTRELARGVEVRCRQRVRRAHRKFRSRKKRRKWPPPKKAEYLKRYGRPGAAEGWHFLTGPQESIDALTKAAGFQYQYDPKLRTSMPTPRPS